MLTIQVGLKIDHDQVLFGLSYVFGLVFIDQISFFFPYKVFNLLLIKFHLCSSLDPFFHSDSIIDRNQCKGNECIFTL
jgi:hypothetical protein